MLISFAQAYKQAMEQVLGIIDEKTRMKVTPPLAVAPIKLTQEEDDMRWNPERRWQCKLKKLTLLRLILETPHISYVQSSKPSLLGCASERSSVEAQLTERQRFARRGWRVERAEFVAQRAGFICVARGCPTRAACAPDLNRDCGVELSGDGESSVFASGSAAGTVIRAADGVYRALLGSSEQRAAGAECPFGLVVKHLA